MARLPINATLTPPRRSVLGPLDGNQLALSVDKNESVAKQCTSTPAKNEADRLLLDILDLEQMNITEMQHQRTSNRASKYNAEESEPRASERLAGEDDEASTESLPTTDADYDDGEPQELLFSDDEDEDSSAIAREFRYVCLQRCNAQDPDGDMAAVGIIEWSMDDFDVIEKLGSGGNASVYCAREKQSGYHVALKVQSAGDSAFLEVDVHEPLDHSSIVRMIDYFYSDDRPSDLGHNDEEDDENEMGSPRRYLIMILELCETSLFDFIGDRGALPEALAALYFLDALNAMEYLHNEHDIIHCDCKSLNFLLADKSTRLKLADFGMAVRFDEREVVGGSPLFMAPEHLMAWRKMTDGFDHRSDVYSLGVILYEMLTGYLPYQVVKSDDDSILAELVQNDDGFFEDPVLDLRKLDDQTCEDPFYIPPPIFPDFVSEEAQGLILSLMEPLPDGRISLAHAKEHAWFKKYNLTSDENS